MLADALETIAVLFIAVAILKLLQGHARSNGLLTRALGASVHPERVPLLVFSLIGISVYVFLAVRNLMDDDPVFPDAPGFLLWALIGSQLLYLVGKYVRKQQRR